MGMGLVEFHEPYSKNEFHVFTNNSSNYYYVEDGFFETRHSIGRTLLTLLHISFIASLYVLLTNQNWSLLIIGKLFMATPSHNSDDCHIHVLISIFNRISQQTLNSVQLNCFDPSNFSLLFSLVTLTTVVRYTIPITVCNSLCNHHC